MFVRKKKNKSGVISVQVIDKSSGLYKVMQTIGSSANAQEVGAIGGKSYLSNFKSWGVPMMATGAIHTQYIHQKKPSCGVAFFDEMQSVFTV